MASAVSQTQRASRDWIDTLFEQLRPKLEVAQETGRYGAVGVRVNMRNGNPHNCEIDFTETMTQPIGR